MGRTDRLDAVRRTNGKQYIFFTNQNPPFEVCTDRLGAVRRTKNVAFIGLIDWMRCVEQMGNNIFFTNQNPIFLFCADWTAVECIRTLHAYVIRVPGSETYLS